MPLRSLLIPLLLLAAPLAAAAQETGASAPADTARPAPAAGTIRLGLGTVAPPFAVSFPEAPGLDAILLRPRFTDWVAAWSRDVRARVEARRDSLWRASRGSEPAARAASRRDSLADAPVRAAADTVVRRRLLPEAVSQYAELGMRVTGRGEMGGAWQRYTPCTYMNLVNCNPSLFPRLKPDIQFGVQVAGTISERVHVDVDYDQRREFDAANNINVYYQGLEDEILQRVEVGDVSIRLPQSRYITQGIPAGNFGFKAAGDLGPMSFQAVWAQQKGDISTREFRLGGGGGAEGLVQDAEAVFDDADYVEGQFFFLVDPERLTGAPHVDVLGLQSADAPPSLRPQGVTLEVYRDEAALPGQQTQVGYFPAEAASETGSVSHTGRFRRLVPGEDYFIHPASGLWIMLRAPLRSDEALAVAYVTESGDTIGTPNADAAPAGTTPSLRLIRGPSSKHQPGVETWRYEMHQVYRIDASSGVEPSSIDLKVSLGDVAQGVTYRTVEGQQVSLLRFFGLDEDSPVDQVDGAQVFQPAASSLGGVDAAARIGGTYVVFPTLRPFARPPAVPSANLTAEQTAAALAADSNSVIYESPDPVLREGGARFRITAKYRVKVDGMLSSFNLGALGIREGSEKITVDGRVLERDRDYTIDYDLGMVSLTDAQSVFGANPGAEIRATWEQQSLFQIAPTSVFGMNTSFKLGTAGELNFLGLYQAEKSVMLRPQLGVEPGSILLGGASGRMDLDAGWLDRALDRIPGLRLGATSKVRLNGELAMSVPTPNLRGDTYLDDFEATDEQALRLDRRAWRLGSRPQSAQGDGLPATFSLANAGRLVWQHDALVNGQIIAGVPVHYIDEKIFVTRQDVASEQQMYLSFGADGATDPAQPLWRSITTVLSATGQDMSRSEYLEVYVASADVDKLKLVFDIGTVSEDAFYFDSAGATRGQYPDGRPWGEGVLDEEARQADREIWGPQADERGLWAQPCAAQPGATYAPGDPLANCARNNGVPDTEDLDGNGGLDPDDGAYFRYVVDLGSNTRFMARDTFQTGTAYRLYRIPLRDLGAGLAMNNAGAATWRFVKHLRMTVVGEPGSFSRGAPSLKLARLRIIGSRWTKRGTSGVVAGLVGDTAGLGDLGTDFRVGPISRLSDQRYGSPPNVDDQAQNATAGLSGQGEEINEKSLRLDYDALPAGHRAEVYYRYPQQPRNLMTYRDLRLWAVPVSGSWGAGGDQRLLVKIATDARNYYLFQTRLKPAAAGARVSEADWMQAVVEFGRWFELKAQAEQQIIAEGPPPAGEPLMLWSADSSYAVVLEDRARAPNLAAVREISFAVYNGGIGAAAGEVWLDELRLGSPVTDPGMAGTVRMEVQGGDFLSASVQYADQGALFQQLNQNPSYQGRGELSLNSRAQLGQFAPASWGIDMPLFVSHARTGSDPTFLDRSDVRADRLEGLRETGSDQTRVGISLRKLTPSANPWASLLLDGAALHLNYNSASTSAITSRAETSGLTGGVDYSRQLSEREIDVTPGFVEGALRSLFPAALEGSELFRRLVDASLRWSPETVSFGTTYSRSESRTFNFEKILQLDADSAVAPIESPREGLENSASVALRPFESVRASVSVTSSRNLLDAGRATKREEEREAIEGALGAVGGVELGWETNRAVTTRLDWRPTIARWLQPGLSVDSRFRGDRNASYFALVEGPEGDSVAVMQRGFQTDRQVTRSLQLDPRALVETLFGAKPDTSAGFAERAARRIGTMFHRVDLTWDRSLGSQFERRTATPGLGYQLGVGDRGDFQVVDGDTASAVRVREGFRVRGGVLLPWSANLTLGYSTNEADVADTRGGSRRQHERRWPEARVSWSGVPIPGPLKSVIVAANVTAGIDRIERTDLYGERERGTLRTDIPLQLGLVLTGGISASYNGTLGSGTTFDPTGDAELERSTHALVLSGSFRAPRGLRERFPNPLQMQLQLNQNSQRECRFRPGFGGGSGETGGKGGDGAEGAEEVAECIPFVDSRTRGLSFSLDTNVSDLTVGVQASYNNNQRFIGTRDGSSQFQLGIFGQFNFEAGKFPAVGGYR